MVQMIGVAVGIGVIELIGIILEGIIPDAVYFRGQD